MRGNFGWLVMVVLLTLAACVPPPAPVTPPAELPPAPPVAPPAPEAPAPPPAPVEKVPALSAVGWDEVEGWGSDEPSQVLDAFLAGCRSLGKRNGWQQVCADAASLDAQDAVAVRLFFETAFVPYQVRNSDGSDSGTITGYYVPDLNGSRERSERYAWPLYAVPDDLLIIDLRSVYPELGDYRLRGRLEGRRVVPYWSRGEIETGKANLAGKELYWVDDPVELFFLQIQGSGRIVFEDGSRIMVHYADQNGHPFRSIGKLLLDRGEMTRDQMSMQNIKAWARANPDRVTSLLAENPSFVFFSELPGRPESPPGALGVPLTPGRSIAVDTRFVPLGAPVFLATSWPSSSTPLQRLVMAQDTGGAIRGAVRADFFWGMGDEAGALAGRMKQKGRMWVLLPQGMTPPGG